MYSPREALGEVLSRVGPRGSIETVPIAEATGRVLAQPVQSDIDLPPFENSAMDGFAVRSADLAGGGGRSLHIVGESRAGEPFTGSVPAGSCVAIYTGAEVPPDCDAVVMVERTERAEGDERVVIQDEVRPGQNVRHKGQDLAVGRTVLEAGKRLRAADVGVLAAAGCEPVPVFARPRVAVLTTGDELVPPSRKPRAGQIREGNTLLLAALCRLAGAEVVRSGLLPDRSDELERAFAKALDECDALITTGGVSMGKYDLVGAAFERVGVARVFHKVKIKPGKPLWFGLRGETPVFALPGNPVSCLVGHAVFVRPALGRMGGESSGDEPARTARWGGAATAPNWREQYLPARRRLDAEGRLVVEPVRWNGSGDVAGLSRADALARIPMDVSVASGETVEWLPLD